jgi:hypothetical protein
MKMKTFLLLSISIFVLILIFFSWFYADYWMTCVFGSFNATRTFGDIFTALGSLFTAFAFAGLIITLLIQKQDINDQKRINNIQIFENNFFRLLEQHHRIIDSFVIEPKSNKEEDRIEKYVEERKKIYQLEAFDFIAKDFKCEYEHVKEIRFPSDKSIQTVFIHAYLHHTYGKYGYMLGHYFRNLYHIVKFIDQSEALGTFSLKYKYVKILRAQLSAPEILLVALNGLTSYGEGFKPLIEKYRLLKNLNLNYEMVDIIWLSGKYTHIIPTVLRENPVFYERTEFESQAKKVIETDEYLRDYADRLSRNK